MRVSICMATFKRANLLKWTLPSLIRQKHKHDVEIVIVNDGMQDETEDVCKQFSNQINIKYIFAGQRHTDTLVPRNPCVPNNIAVKQSSGEIIILTCPEIYHLDNSISLTVDPICTPRGSRYMSIPDFMYFDDTGVVEKNLSEGSGIDKKKLSATKSFVKMPFWMGMRKNLFCEIGGYDEDFETGYAGEDNDLVDRLLKHRLTYSHNKSRIIHMYHGPRCDSVAHHDNPKWVHNYKLWKGRSNIIVRNVGKEWGVINVAS